MAIDFKTEKKLDVKSSFLLLILSENQVQASGL